MCRKTALETKDAETSVLLITAFYQNPPKCII